MDLDKIKEIWRDTDINPAISEENICKILDNKGKSALNKLKFYEKLSLCLLPLFIFMPFIHNKIFEGTAPYSLLTMSLFIGACIVGFFWQIIKIRLLAKITPDNMDILSGSKYITQYRQYIHYERLVTVCWLIVFILTYAFSFIHIFSGKSLIFYIIYIAALMAIAIIIILFFYKWFYSKKIHSIEQSIKEIEDFEKDNN